MTWYLPTRAKLKYIQDIDICQQNMATKSEALLSRLYNSWLNEKTVNLVFLASKGIQKRYFLLF